MHQPPEYLSLMCPSCKHVGLCVVPITVEGITCWVCGHWQPAPDDFRKHDASFMEHMIQSEKQAQLLQLRTHMKGQWIDDQHSRQADPG